MEKIKNGITELVIVIDKSGSMEGLEEDTIGGINAMLKEQKSIDGECYVTAVMFNEAWEFTYDRVKLSQVKPLTKKDYRVGGCTALIDALGSSIEHIETIHKYIRKEDVPEHVMFFITTDGLENASHKFSSDDVKRKIEAKKEVGWEFVFAGANIDAVETAKTYGIAEENAFDYHADSIGTNVIYKCAGKKLGAMRRNMPSVAWREEADADFESR
ncbi:MAG: VWA domain-containing protein [Lachnospiraceae bacterium]|nr:VWA domain-containing protein [Lachnospiraceae bacterium]